MKKIWFLTLVLFAFSCSSDNGGDPPPIDPPVDDPSVSGITPCENGMASIYPCDGYDLVGRINLGIFEANSANDIWGWTDPDTDKEYAVVGLDNGTAFVV